MDATLSFLLLYVLTLYENCAVGRCASCRWLVVYIIDTVEMSASKLDKEAFVTGLSGTTQGEVLAIVAALPLFSWQVSLLVSTLPLQDVARAAIVATFLVLVVSFPGILLPFYVASAALCAHIFCWNKVRTKLHSTTKRPYFMSTFRSTMMLYTVISILGVDFHLFPRRLAKTETFGTGLMDLGVGAFVVANGMVSSSSSMSIRKLLRKAAPLVALGLLRLFTLKTIDYQEHVSEYGQHWNFFFTMVVVAVSSSSLCYVFPRIFLDRPGLAGLALTPSTN